MPAICLYLQVHQPYRLRRYTFFDLGFSRQYEDEGLNEEVIHRVTDRSYVPMAKSLGKLIEESEGKFKVTFSMTGMAMEQLQQYRPDGMEAFAKLASHKQVEVLAETYYHSLAGLYDFTEFERQIKLHRKAVKEHFGRVPKVFRNTELIYSERLAQKLKGQYKGILAEGVNWHLQGGTPNQLYRVPKSDGLGLLLRNYRLSDDIAFRFGQGLDAKEFLRRLQDEPGEVVNLYMDWETFGEHHAKDTGIFDFMEALVRLGVEQKVKFTTPGKVIKQTEKPPKLNIGTTTSWADEDRDPSAWNGNDMQRFALKKVYELGKLVRELDQDKYWNLWGRLQTSDHFYYMSTKRRHDGQVHAYFNPFTTPYDAYIHYMNVLSDVELRLQEVQKKEKG